MKRSFLVIVLLLLAAGLAAVAWWWRTGVTESADPAMEAGRSRPDSEIELPPAGPAAPDGVDVAELAAPFRFGAGHSISVLDLRETAGLGDDSALVADFVEVEVCAGDGDLVGAALPPAFALAYPLRGGGYEFRAGASSADGQISALATGLRGETVPAGACRDGWVVFVLGEDGRHDRRRPSSIVFDNTGFGFVPEADRARHAWRWTSE